MADFIVTTLADELDSTNPDATLADFGGAGDLSLREALVLANAAAGADTITFAAGLAGQTITLTRGELVIASDVTIDGDIVGNDNRADITIDANHASRVFNVDAGTSTLDSLTITGGEAGSGNGGAVHTAGGTNLTIVHSTVSDSHAYLGGGIASDGTLTLTGSTLTGNSSSFGGGAYLNGTATLTDVAIADNSASMSGGGLLVDGTATLINVTVAANSATYDGGGIYNDSVAELAVINSTLTGNSASRGGIFNLNDITLTNSIVAGNQGGDIEDWWVTTYTGVNIVGVGGDTNAGDHVVNTPSLDVLFASVGGNGLVVTTGLLADNGGPVQTVALKASSANPAIDGGQDSLAPTTDARGEARLDSASFAPNGANVSDIGAYELRQQSETPDFVVTTSSDVVDAFDGLTSLREALAYANSLTGAHTITFAAGLAGQTIALAQGELVIHGDVTIDGDIVGNDDKADITIDAHHDSRVFNVGAGTATLDSLNLTGGETTGLGAAVRIADVAQLTIAHSTVSDSHAYEGGGIGNEGALTLTDSTLTGNSADFGGGLCVLGTATLTSVTIAENSAQYGGGIYNEITGELAVINSTLTGNSASAGTSGGIYNFNDMVLTNSIVAGNQGGDIADFWVAYYTGVNIVGVGTDHDAGDHIVNAPNLDALFASVGPNALGVTTGLAADNGGPVQTVALAASGANPAIDGGQDSLAPTTDARGFDRADLPGTAPNGANTSDIGAFELQIPAQVSNTGLTLDEGATATISASALTFNEAGLADSALVFTITAAATNGTLRKNGNALAVGDGFTQDDIDHNRITYTHDGGETTTAAFGFSLSDGVAPPITGQSFTFTINPVNDAPVAHDGSASGTEDTVITGTVPVASDPDSASLTYILVAQALHGSVTLRADGTFSYTPVADYSGTDRFSFKANDGSLDSNVATFDLTVNPVNDAPVAQAGSASGTEDTVMTGTVPAASDPDSASLTYILVAQALHGAVTLHADGTFSYTPDADYSGTDRFGFKANDGALDSNVAMFDLTVAAVNDAPVNHVPGTQHVVGHTDTAITGLSMSDLDAASGLLSTSLSVAHGTLTVASVGGPTVTGNGTGTVTLTGTQAQIDAALSAAGVIYHGAQGFTGIDLLTMTTSDNGNTGSGGALTDTDQVQIVVSTPSAETTAHDDFNGDGRSDILWQNRDGTPAMWSMDGLTMTAGANVGFNPGAAWHEIGSGDFNGDGKSDILWQNADGTVAEWFLDGTTRTSGGSIAFNPGPAWHAIGAADFNGDGKSDILWQNADGTPAIWLMDGLHILSGTNVGFNPGPTWHVIDSGDFNGDGKADILWQNNSGQAAVWLMNGTSVISGADVGFNPGPSWSVQAAGDFNGDGKADILWQNHNGQAAVWLMDGTSRITGDDVGFNPGPTWQIHDAADFNGDGKADILWQNTDGTPAVWLMNGLSVVSGANVGFDPGTNWHVVPQHHDLLV